MTLTSLLLPATFGVIGTVIGGLITIYGQSVAERREQEKRREEHFLTAATELVTWLGERADAVSLALAYSGEESRRHARDAYERLPISHFTLIAQSTVPFLAEHIENYTRFELQLMRVCGEIAEETQPFARYDEKQRHAMVERLVILQRPILAGLADVIAQLSPVYPKRLSTRRVTERADAQRVPTKEK